MSRSAVRTAEDWELHHLLVHLRSLDWPDLRRVLAKRQVRAARMIVLVDESSQQPL